MLTEKIRLRSIEGMGENWATIMRWADAAFRNAGFETELSRKGRDGIDTCRWLTTGETDVTVSLTSAAAMADKSTGVFRGEHLRGVRGLAGMIHYGHYFHNIVKADTGVREFADLARVKPKLGLCIASPGFIAGQITRAYLKHYGVDVDRDIAAWGGEIYNVMRETTAQWMDGRANALMRENTRFQAVGQASSIYDLSFLSLDREVAEAVAKEYCLDVVDVPAKSFRGQDRPVITVANPGYAILVREDLPADLVYRLAKALDVSSASHAISEDIFYSTRHAPHGGAPTHPGAAAYYDEVAGRYASSVPV
jgi:TRAP-type uncharacterized transport system substrate-binding protein